MREEAQAANLNMVGDRKGKESGQRWRDMISTGYRSRFVFGRIGRSEAVKNDGTFVSCTAG